MIKKFLIIFGILIISFININYAANPTLDRLAKTFNNSSLVKEYESLGAEWNATANDNVLNITLEGNGQFSNLEYRLDGSVLSITIDTNDTEVAATNAIVSIILADCVGQLHGYKEGEVTTTLNANEAENFTVEIEGFEAKKIASDKVIIKMDINKKIPLFDFSNTYLEVEDLNEFKEYIAGNGFAQTFKGNIIFHKTGYADEAIVTIAEKNTLTENSYKTILSMLEVMFSSNKAQSYFRENYSSISIGNKEFTGFKIEVNPTKTTSDEFLLGINDTYKFLRITIDKDAAKLNIRDFKENQVPEKEENESNGLSAIVSYDPLNTNTTGKVTVTIKTNKKVNKVAGWKLSLDGMTLTKSYSKNEVESVNLVAEEGSTQTVRVVVSNILKEEANDDLEQSKDEVEIAEDVGEVNDGSEITNAKLITTNIIILVPVMIIFIIAIIVVFKKINEEEN